MLDRGKSDDLRLSLAGYYLKLGNTQEAAKLADQLLEDYRDPGRGTDLRIAEVWKLRAEMLIREGSYAAALTMLDGTLRTFVAKLGKFSTPVQSVLTTKCDLLARMGEVEGGLECRKTLYEGLRHIVGDGNAGVWVTLFTIEASEFHLGRNADAIVSLTRSFEGLKKVDFPQKGVTLGSGFLLAWALLRADQPADALSLVDGDLRKLAAENKEENSQEMLILRGLIRLRQGHRAEALALLGPAVPNAEKRGEKNPIVQEGRAALDRLQASSS